MTIKPQCDKTTLQDCMNCGKYESMIEFHTRYNEMKSNIKCNGELRIFEYVENKYTDPSKIKYTL